MNIDPYPLTGELIADDLILSLAQLLRRLRSEAGSANAHALGLSQIGVIARLHQTGPMTTADLARIEFMKPQSMGTILSDLERLKLVQRERHPTDGRQVLYSLTQEGIEERNHRRSTKKAWLAGAMETLRPEELEILARVIPIIQRISDA
ncbi:MarR family winged helix-turn-helix transcriptional regulator [Acidithiobacillus ferriphilus]|jgi:DNA-binding MarR family transcriptional regulator|uniref:MarR family winged helix-turn-helix transcriptional regulator n=1 Tax=Acidithiobacillus ferriphilus TaxID=1689834 RepID=UPI001C07E17D|nr:MarR family transcriptional regulator [Acidithiobacillus ferriphilus]MBU2831498.1 MarR family transcriptional regulator [Acidithiobacillus ferriphilus]